MNAERNNAGSSVGESSGGGTVVVGGDSRHSPPNQQQQQHPSQQQQHHHQQQQIHIRHSVSFLDFSSPTVSWSGGCGALFIFFSSLWEAFLFLPKYDSYLCVFPASAVGRAADRGRCYPASGAGKLSFTLNSTQAVQSCPRSWIEKHKRVGEALVIFGNFLFYLTLQNHNLSIGI